MEPGPQGRQLCRTSHMVWRRSTRECRRRIKRISGPSLESQTEACVALAEREGYESPEGLRLVDSASGATVGRPELIGDVTPTTAEYTMAAS